MQKLRTKMRMKKLVLLMQTLALASQPAWAADDPVARRLIEQARYWQQKNRNDLASDAWHKLLRANPADPVGLIELGMLEARAGRVKEAEELYVSASRLNPPPPGLSELATALKVGTAPPAALSNAREQAQGGNADEAVKSYRGILGETKPTGQFGLEYYTTLGATREGWEEARRGLEELARNNPGDTRYMLALAKHLTYREPTRREGIRQLAALAAREPAAQKSWRQALVWLGARPGDRALFQAYLTRYADDQAVIERMRQLDRPVVVYRPDPKDIARQAGFRLLEQGDIVAAEAQFRSALAKNPNDADALGGLGSIRLRQEAFDEAARLLDQARSRDKRGGAQWKKAADSAHYWALMQEVTDARQAGRLNEVEGKLQQALGYDSKEPTGQVMLADLYTERRETAKAEAIYRQVLRTSPMNPGAFRGLIFILVQDGRDAEAMRMVSTLDPASAQKIGGLNQAKAAALLKLATADEARRDYDSAAERLEDALLLDPLSPWVRLALARQYQNMGDSAGANALLDNLLDTNPDLPEALFARALLFSEQGRSSEALATLERIPVSKRTASIANEQRRLWVNVQVQRAKQFYAQGNAQRANGLMAQAEAAAAQDVGMLGQIAGGWSELGQPASALRVMRELASRSPSDNIGLRIQYASVLLSTRQDAELSAILRELSASNRLTATQQDDVNKIILAYTLRQTESLREAGRLAEAFEVVSPALEQSGDPRLIMALARIYNSSGDAAQALKLTESAIAREPDDLEYRLFASAVALGAGAVDKAAGQAKAALELAPDFPRALAAAGRAEKARGNLPKAMEYFQYAQALEREKGAFSGVPGNLSLRLVDETQAPTSQFATAGTRSERTGLLPVPDSSRRGARTSATQESASDPGYAAPATNPFTRPEPRSNILPVPATGARRSSDQGLAPLRVAPDRVNLQPRQSDASVALLQYQSPPVSAYERPAAPAQRTVQAAPVSYYERPAEPVQRYVQAPAPSSGFDPGAMRPVGLAVADTRRRLPDYLDPPVTAVRPPAPSLLVEPVRQVAQVTQTTVASTVRERTIGDEINDIKLKFSTVLEFGAGYRKTGGEAGLGRLGTTELPLEARIPIDYQGKVTLRLSPVLLSAGTLNLQDPKISARFGSEAIGGVLALPHAAREENANGLALSAAYQSDNLNADIGTTPRGFKVANVVGGIGVTERIDDVTLRAGVNRRAITDSLLSYAGTTDPRTGQVWGGVVKTGARVEAGYGEPGGGVYANAAYSALTGTGVKSNNEGEASVGGYLRAYKTADTQATVGLNLSVMGFRNNLGNFTLGHGGYFSPQRYISLGVPFDVAGRRNRLSYQVGGDVSVRQFSVDRAPYFPTDAVAQATWEAQIIATPQLAGYSAYYPADTVTGLGYNFYGAFEYLLAPKFALGGRLTFDNSRNYSQQSGLMYLRYSFDAMPEPVQYPPRTMRVLSSGDPQ
jgi:tetratricopeptide (TPR) repeat protein